MSFKIKQAKKKSKNIIITINGLILTEKVGKIKYFTDNKANFVKKELEKKYPNALIKKQIGEKSFWG